MRLGDVGYSVCQLTLVGYALFSARAPPPVEFSAQPRLFCCLARRWLSRLVPLAGFGLCPLHSLPSTADLLVVGACAQPRGSRGLPCPLQGGKEAVFARNRRARKVWRERAGAWGARSQHGAGGRKGRVPSVEQGNGCLPCLRGVPDLHRHRQHLLLMPGMVSLCIRLMFIF